MARQRSPRVPRVVRRVSSRDRLIFPSPLHSECESASALRSHVRTSMFPFTVNLLYSLVHYIYIHARALLSALCTSLCSRLPFRYLLSISLSSLLYSPLRIARSRLLLVDDERPPRRSAGLQRAAPPPRAERTLLLHFILILSLSLNLLLGCAHTCTSSEFGPSFS